MNTRKLHTQRKVLGNSSSVDAATARKRQRRHNVSTSILIDGLLMHIFILARLRVVKNQQ